MKRVMVASGIPGGVAEVNYVRTAAEGIFSRTEHSQEVLAYPSELVEGTTWTVSQEGRTIEWTVEAVEDLKLLDRTYEKCLRMYYRDSKGEQEGVVHVALRIGAVRWIHKTQGITTEMTLQTYQK